MKECWCHCEDQSHRTDLIFDVKTSDGKTDHFKFCIELNLFFSGANSNNIAPLQHNICRSTQRLQCSPPRRNAALRCTEECSVALRLSLACSSGNRCPRLWQADHWFFSQSACLGHLSLFWQKGTSKCSMRLLGNSFRDKELTGMAPACPHPQG